MEKYFPIFIVLFFIVIFSIVLYILFIQAIKQSKLLNGVVNYDMFMRKFVFRVNASQAAIIERLKLPNINDKLNYQFNENTAIITFEKYGAQISYKLMIEDFGEYCVLKTEQISLIAERSQIPHDINAFWIQKLDAIPLEFESNKF